MYNYLNVCFYFAILYIANYNHLYLVCEGNKSILNLNLNLLPLFSDAKRLFHFPQQAGLHSAEDRTFMSS